MRKQIFTIGHSAHDIEQFISLLIAHDVTALADVRSRPFSRFHPQFNRDALKSALARAGIAYVFLGDELGARPDEPGVYEEGRVIYSRLAATPRFRHGLRRVLQGSERFQIALMCAEKDPLTCHRTILVARHLESPEHPVTHILPDGTLEPHTTAEERLLRAYELHRPELFRTRSERLEEAYRLRETEIAWSERTSEASNPQEGASP